MAEKKRELHADHTRAVRLSEPVETALQVESVSAAAVASSNRSAILSAWHMPLCSTTDKLRTPV